MSLTTAYIGIGSNLGDRRSYVDNSIRMLEAAPAVQLRRVSEIVETASLLEGQPDYLNAVAEIATDLDPHALLKTLNEIETLLGRIREEQWGARTIDLDLLLFGDAVIDESTLTVPHAQMHLRSFVLTGLCELAPDLVHPTLGVSIQILAERLAGGNFFLDPAKPQLISIAGLIGAGKTTLAKKLARILGGEVLPEPYDTNPYLPKVYAGDHKLALDSQLFFLDGRVKQLQALDPGRIVISDYVFDKELIYARRLLDPDQLKLYEDIHGPMAEKVAQPVLAIYVQAPPDICLERIRNRNRPYEQRIEDTFLDTLRADYDALFADWRACPVIRIPTEELDYSVAGTVEHIAAQVSRYIAHQGRPAAASTAD